MITKHGGPVVAVMPIEADERLNNGKMGREYRNLAKGKTAHPTDAEESRAI